MNYLHTCTDCVSTIDCQSTIAIPIVDVVALTIPSSLEINGLKHQRLPEASALAMEH